METDKMSAKGIAEWLDLHGQSQWESIIASRDAYRERQALEKATEKAKKWYQATGLYLPSHWDGLKAAILNTPRFERGQLVRLKGDHDGWAYEWGSTAVANPNHPEDYEPVLDREGRPVYLPVEDRP